MVSMLIMGSQVPLREDSSGHKQTAQCISRWNSLTDRCDCCAASSCNSVEKVSLLCTCCCKCTQNAVCTDIQKSMATRLMIAMLTGVLGRDLGVLTDNVLARGDVPLLNLGVKLPLLLAFRLLTCLKTLQQVSNMSC